MNKLKNGLVGIQGLRAFEAFPNMKNWKIFVKDANNKYKFSLWCSKVMKDECHLTLISIKL